MAYITREDGERFIIPSYRDVISAKKTSLLKREILLLCQNYGDYITLHKKNIEQYEVAFSNEAGYLLGESIWNYFKRPNDLIYCEQIPNTNDAILVIVKSGSVYLDGSFPIDSIPEELVVFRTQQNNFDIYLYGDIPISQVPEAGKFAFDPSSVRSFNILSEPIFQKIPAVKSFQLQLVDTVLTAQGIGVFPLKKLGIVVSVIFLIWLGWDYISSHKKELPTVIVGVVNPYQNFMDALTTPDPASEIHSIYHNIKLLFTIPGWSAINLEYIKGSAKVLVRSDGTNTSLLFNWASQNGKTIVIQPNGFYVTWNILLANRQPPRDIFKLNEVIGHFVDRMHAVLPTNMMQLTAITDRRAYSETQLTISFQNITPDLLDFMGQQLKDLPLVLNKVSLTINNGTLSGSIVLQALGYTNTTG